MRFFRRLLLLALVVGLIGRVFQWWSFTKGFLVIMVIGVLPGLVQVVLIVLSVSAMFYLGSNNIYLLREHLNFRFPLLGGWMRRKAVRALGQLLQQGDDYAAEILAEAVTSHEDNKVRRIAETMLGQITSQPCIDAVVAVWENTRHLALTTLLVTHDWVASTPVNVRVLSALKTGHLDPLNPAHDRNRLVAKEVCRHVCVVAERRATLRCSRDGGGFGERRQLQVSA